MESQPPFSRANKHRNTARIRPVFSYLSNILNHYVRTVYINLALFLCLYNMWWILRSLWSVLVYESTGIWIHVTLRVTRFFSFLLKMARGFENVCSGGSRRSDKGEARSSIVSDKWGWGGGGLKISFRPFGPHFVLKIRGRRLPGPLPWIRHWFATLFGLNSDSGQMKAAENV